MTAIVLLHSFSHNQTKPHSMCLLDILSFSQVISIALLKTEISSVTFIEYSLSI